MNSIKHILARYSQFVWSHLLPLGGWGLFIAAILDSAAFAVPVDIAFAGFVYSNPAKMWLYIIATAVGSSLGCLVPYWIGRAGGELLLLKHVDRHRFERMRDRFENQEFFAIMIPAMLPPPTPLKLFLLSAGVFEMRPLLFLLSVFSGRLIRFVVFGFLVARFGPGILGMVVSVTKHHLIWVLVGLVLLIALGVTHIIQRSSRSPAKTEPPTAA